MAYRIRLLTVHTSDVSHKLFPLQRIFCPVRKDARIGDLIVDEVNVDGLARQGIIDAANVGEILDFSRIELSQTRLEYGPVSIESDFDDVLASPYIVGRAIEAEQEGCDAVVIDCFGDPALHAAREAVRIPVIGAGEAAMRLAATVGHQFGVVTVAESVRRILDEQ
jgi:hypothetical protein